MKRLVPVLLLLAAVAKATSDSTWSIDKAEHVIASAGFAGLVYVGAARILPHWPAMAVAAGTTMSLALGKEWWDTRHDSYWSWKDLAADATGVLLTAAIATAVKSWGRRHSSHALPVSFDRRAVLVESSSLDERLLARAGPYDVAREQLAASAGVSKRDVPCGASLRANLSVRLPDSFAGVAGR